MKKYALVTGGSGGIGSAISKQLIRMVIQSIFITITMKTR